MKWFSSNGKMVLPLFLYDTIVYLGFMSHYIYNGNQYVLCFKDLDGGGGKISIPVILVRLVDINFLK